MSKFTAEEVKRILGEFGYKCYKSGKEEYFLQSKAKIRPMTKIGLGKMMKLFNGEDAPVPSKKKDGSGKGISANKGKNMGKMKNE